MAATIRTRIREDLIEQLESQGRFGEFYIDMIDDYMILYDLKKELKTDIKNNGLRYKMKNGNGFEIDKPNESIINFTKVNTQMLKILTDLGLKEPSEPPGDGNDLL